MTTRTAPAHKIFQGPNGFYVAFENSRGEHRFSAAGTRQTHDMAEAKRWLADAARRSETAAHFAAMEPSEV